jgi:hypothetical protein
MLSDPLDTFARRAVLERPSCRKCGHPIRAGRNSAGAAGYQEVRFECSTCGDRKTLVVPVDPHRIDMVGWLASELRPPK